MKNTLNAVAAALDRLNAHHLRPSDDLHSMVLSQAGHVHDLKADLADMTRERGEWKARAEKAEQLIPRYAMLDIWVALGRDSLHFDDWYDEHGYADAWAELTAAVREARTAPAVTKADIEECVYGSRRAGRECDKQGFVPVHVQEAVERLCDLLGIEAEQAVDPAEALADDFARILAGDEHIGGSWSMDPSDWRDITLALAKRAKDVLGQESSSDE